jgi:hypothetical protein
VCNGAGLDEASFQPEQGDDSERHTTAASLRYRKGKPLTQTPAAKLVTGPVPHCCHAGFRLAAAASRGVLGPSSAMSHSGAILSCRPDINPRSIFFDDSVSNALEEGRWVDRHKKVELQSRVQPDERAGRGEERRR